MLEQRIVLCLQITSKHLGQPTFGNGRLFRPEDNRGVTHLKAMPVATRAGEYGVEGGGIAERGRFRNRCVVALALAIGGEGITVEGNQQCARGLRTGNPLELGFMDVGDGRLLPGDQAKAGRNALLLLMFRPPVADALAFVDISGLANQLKNAETGAEFGQFRMTFDLLRLPQRQKSANRRKSFVVDLPLHGQMPVAKSFARGACACLLAFLLRVTEQVKKVVPEEAWIDAAARRLGLTRHQQLNGHLLFAAALAPVFDGVQPAVRAQHHRKTDFLQAVTGWSNGIFRLGGQAIIQLMK